uniref:Transcription factor CBF/NF-Y/archaeal histone domain-containing protein n=1 Tax=Ananas comosus var. bracteatus TaxID=296719 RepID=A0A6V7PCD3_ANACO|nr:unnamed protein product [Ananas comosus var. bracteatus]
MEIFFPSEGDGDHQQETFLAKQAHGHFSGSILGEKLEVEEPKIGMNFNNEKEKVVAPTTLKAFTVTTRAPRPPPLGDGRRGHQGARPPPPDRECGEDHEANPAPNAKISKEAKETMQECVSEFISFVTGEASDKCHKEKRKTVNGDDICWALSNLGFDDYAEPMRRYLQKYREMEGDRAASGSHSNKASGSDARDQSPGSGHHFMFNAMGDGILLAKMDKNIVGAQNFSREEHSDVQGHLLPIANVGRIMKQALPPNAKISQRAKETMQECASEFINFITGEASDRCLKEKRKTINGEDICYAMKALGLDEYADVISRYLHKYRASEERATSLKQKKGHSNRYSHAKRPLCELPMLIGRAVRLYDAFMRLTASMRETLVHVHQK